MAERPAIPRAQQCAFCSQRGLIAIGGKRLCAKHKTIVEEIAADAGVPIHLTIHRLTRSSPETARPPEIHTLG